LIRAQLSPALRTLGRRPGLALARLLTVAALITATAAVAAIASATLLRPLPFPVADRLVAIYSIPDETTDFTRSTPLFPVEFEHLDARDPAIDAIAGIWVLDRAVTGRGEPDSVSGGRATASLFPMLGATMTLGRTFTDDEARQDAPVVVLSHGLWTRMFGGDPKIVGTAIHIDRRPYTVIGVTAPGFEPAFTASQFWTPLRFADVTTLRASVVQTIGRLRPGATITAASAGLDAVTRAARAHMPDLVNGSSVRAIDLREARYGSRRSALLMLSVMVAALILLATANLANLTMADLASRMSDFALRSALGGSARAIALAEIIPCSVIALAGSILGLWIAATGVPLMLALDPSLASAGLDLAIDWRVALISISCSCVVMALAVVMPSWRMARRDQLAFFNSARLTDARAGRIRAWLVGAQTALALVLLSAAALVVTTVQRNAHRSPGFDPSRVVTGQLRLADNAFPDHGARVRFVRAVLDKLRDTPGITGAATTLNLFKVGSSFTTNVTVEDAPRPDGSAYSTEYRRVSPGYFEAMRIALRRGRTFLDSDTDRAPLVAVVSESFASQYWPNGDAIGRRIKRGAAASPWAEIVGVVADVRDAGLTQETGPVMYTSYYQGSTAATPAGLIVRTAGDPRNAIQQIKQAVWSIDPAQPLSSIAVLDDYLAASLGPQQFRAWLVSVCSAFGLLLAVIGIYGVTSRSVQERTKEVGIRIALGGDPSVVWWRLVLTSLRAIVSGVAVGAAASFAVDRGIVQLLPELGSPQWSFRMVAALAMAATGAVAAVAAARHAAAIEPVGALRGD
jgi:putative ABC transport system permease protein